LNLYLLKSFYHITCLQIVVTGYAETAVETCGDFLGIVLETLERTKRRQ
jgi:hypothetical protein